MRHKEDELYNYFLEAEDNDDLDFNDVRNKRNQRPEIHALIMLSDIFPIKDDINTVLSCYVYGKLILSFDVNDRGLTKDEVLELLRCGVFMDDDHGLHFML